MANSNPPFDDFLELNMFDPSNSDMLSLLFNNDDLNITSFAASAVPALDMDLSVVLGPLSGNDPPNTSTSIYPETSSTDITVTPIAADFAIIPENKDIKRDEQRDIQLLLAINRQLQQQKQQEEIQQSVKSNAMAIPCIDNSIVVAQLINAGPLSVNPQAPTGAASLATPAASPLGVTLDMDSTLIATATTATADAQIAALIDSSKATITTTSVTTPISTTVATSPNPSVVTPASTATKRPNPESAPAAKKLAKIESTAVINTKSSSKTTTSGVTPANGTLSDATLQFLLQQQSQTPLAPQLFTGKLTRKEIEETLARLLEATRYLLLASQEAGDDNEEESPTAESEEVEMEDINSGELSHEQPAGQKHGLKTQPGIKTDDIPSSADLKKMTSKERRQLRNKISARNFRVRRKEYIGELEGQVEQHKTEARHLREAVVVMYEENKRLKEELEEAKRQLAQTTTNTSATVAPHQTASVPATTLSSEDKSLLASILTRTAFNANTKSNPFLSLPRSQSPTLTPDLKKDVPNSSSVSVNEWKNKTPIPVHTVHVPEIYIGEQLQFGPKASGSKEDDMWDRPWLNVERTPKELSKEEKNPFLLSSVVYELMQTFATTTWNMMVPQFEIESLSRELIPEDSKAIVQDYENDKLRAEAKEWKIQHDLTSSILADMAVLDILFDRDVDWLYSSMVADL
ncbi:hypothetical protein BGZ65_006866, partial [Modicella reniformis]